MPINGNQRNYPTEETDDAPIDIAEAGAIRPPRGALQRFVRHYRILEFGSAVVLYLLALVFAEIEVHERPIPGIKVRLNATAVAWSLDPSINEVKLSEEGEEWNHDVVWDGVTNLCTDAAGEKEGRKSFPSGHASFAWASMLVLAVRLRGVSLTLSRHKTNVDYYVYYSSTCSADPVLTARIANKAKEARSEHFDIHPAWAHTFESRPPLLKHMSSEYIVDLTTVWKPHEEDDAGAHRSKRWQRLLSEYRVAEFGCTLVQLNSTTSVWARDPTINNKEKAQQVPMIALVGIGVGAPIIVNLFINYALPKFHRVRIIPHDTRDFFLTIVQSTSMATLLTQFTKNMTGRFRPCFYDMCKWNYDVVWDGVTNLCQSASGEKEGRKSFPSGHASFAFATMLVLTRDDDAGRTEDAEAVPLLHPHVSGGLGGSDSNDRQLAPLRRHFSGEPADELRASEGIKGPTCPPRHTRFYAGIGQSASMSELLTEFTKNLTGRFRPSFHGMCGWQYDVVWDGVNNLCTDPAGEKEGRKSFPSGHASFAWSTMLVLTMYKRGGVFFVTARILVVDLLSNHVDPGLISGLLVNDAHHVTETSIEAFILRLYRERNREGFIKGFCDDSVALSSGFNRVEQVLKHLYVRNVFLYPRFHVTINSCLEEHQPEVYEIEVAFSPSMKIMQEALLVALEATVKELQRNKQLVGDLSTLRQLLAYLPRYDAISYYSFLVNYQTMNGQQRFPSPWLFTDAADRLLTAAKERLYQIVDPKTNKPVYLRQQSSNGSGPNAADNAELKLVLELNPKWDALKEILDEVYDEQSKKMENKDKLAAGGANVLVMVKDERTCAQLREFLSLGAQEMMRRRFGHYLLQKEATLKQKGGSMSSLGLEQRLLLEAAAKLRSDDLYTEEDAAPSLGTSSKNKSSKTKKRVREESSQSSYSGVQVHTTEVSSFDQPAGMPNLSLEVVESLDSVVLCTYEQATEHGYGASAFLEDLMPSCIVLYDPDMAFIREVEVFHASHIAPLEIYFLMYDESTEQQSYLSEIQREKRAFDKLIHQKAHLMMPANVYDLPLHMKLRQQTVEYSMDTRTGGRAKSYRAGVKVVVDVREFRSALPSMLHKEGLFVLPVTLEIGDYVLSPEICVERKSISDLFGSLNSGRLFNQAESMRRFYKTPVLLIEFTQGKAFSLQDVRRLAQRSVPPTSSPSLRC
ncbi:DNA repair nuclease, XPF-type/Helicase [Phytophthora cactorum]|nr:DNA repair nuclease, XPF-type/Helicase [Phytophthora cactorum]